MRSFHPQHPQFEALRLAYLQERGDLPRPALASIEPGLPLSVGMRHADIVLIRQKLAFEPESGEDRDLLDRRLMQKISAFMQARGLSAKRTVDNAVRAAVNAAEPARVTADRNRLQKFVVNLERWRTLPAEFGHFHIWNNLPEFQTRVVKNGEIIHQERIIIGQPATQTPVFSDVMDHIIFQPEWGVPESIKISQLLPHLRGGNYGILERRNMSVREGTEKVKASRYRWSKVDIRNVTIVQGPGPGNPLGRLKFIFPNHHDVYMHDTQDKYLFESRERTFSHGCVRVRNPERLAEILLGEIEGWTVDDVQRQLKIPQTMRIDLKQRIPVHLTYFTLWANADGTVSEFKDVYSHDARYGDALAGKAIALIAARDPALAQKKKNEELRKSSVAYVQRRKPAPVKLVQQPLSKPWSPPGFSFFQ